MISDSRSRFVIAFTLIVIGVGVVGLQVVATWQTSKRAQDILTQIEELEAPSLSEATARGELAEIRIRNEIDRFFWRSLITSLLPLLSAAVALVGAWVGLQKYLDARDKERLDRAAVDLAQVLERLSSVEPRERTIGLVGIQHFFRPDKVEYHLRALTALAAVARTESEEEVQRTLRLAVEQAVATVDPDLLCAVSWRGVKLSGVDLSHQRLSGLDLRDAVLEDAALEGAVLRNAKLTNARLNGSDLEGADLRGADLSYADLAGAKLLGARLSGAVLREAKVLRLDLAGADLRGAVLDPDGFRWDLVRNWREAVLEVELRAQLNERYGPPLAGPRVLMLLWEAPPMVAGGTWTAAYHLVRHLKQTGARVTVAVPWSDWALTPLPFDTDVRVISMGIDPPQSQMGEDGNQRFPYGSPYWSPYGRAQVSSPYETASDSYLVGPYGSSPYAGARPSSEQQGGSGLLRLMDVFAERVAKSVSRGEFDLIHAHDWVTFPAAIAGAEHGIDWVGHFHSTEGERHPDLPSPVLQRLERDGAHRARVLVVPSNTTKERLTQDYQVDPARIHVVPNSAASEEVRAVDMGSFEERRVVFLGRLSRQKGPDLFARIAEEVLRRRSDVLFVAYGDGEESSALDGTPVRLLGRLDWAARGMAFRGATVVVVPSRAEPFGMVILEAMQHRVPVLYPASSGAAEVLKSGVPIDPEDAVDAANRLVALLDDWELWEKTVKQQAEEVAEYSKRGEEGGLNQIWAGLVTQPER